MTPSETINLFEELAQEHGFLLAVEYGGGLYRIKHPVGWHDIGSIEKDVIICMTEKELNDYFEGLYDAEIDLEENVNTDNLKQELQLLIEQNKLGAPQDPCVRCNRPLDYAPVSREAFCGSCEITLEKEIKRNE